MKESGLSREQALDLLLQYNKDPFHIQHALTVEQVMGWYAEQLGHEDEKEFWSTVGLLHDLDFEEWPEEHCIKAPELLREVGATEELVHGVVSHGYGLTVETKPEHEMEKVLYASDELTGLIGAAVLMRPSKSVQDLEVKSLKKKFKSKGFAAGCSRDVIKDGAEMLGWPLDRLFEQTILAMREGEDKVREETDQLAAVKQ